MKLKSLMGNKKAQLGLNTVKAVMITILVLAVLGISIILATTQLRDAGIFNTGSQEKNDTDMIVKNVTAGLLKFFQNTKTIFAILVAVVIILAIAIIIAVVSRFGGGGATTGL